MRSDGPFVQGPAGFDPETFKGLFINFLSFADYLLPLAARKQSRHRTQTTS
jgi:hypothetical protein